MKKTSFLKLDVVLIVLATVFVFLNNKGVFPSVLMIIYLLTASIYFFPMKLILKNRAHYEIISDLIIAYTLIFAILFKFKEFEYVPAIFSIVNFGYIIYYVFFVFNEKNLSNIHRLVILSHFIVTSTISINT